MMTIREMFEKSKKHLLTQMEKAKAANGLCSYRTEAGLSCAVGCLLKDEDYDPSFEGVRITNIVDSILNPREEALLNACKNAGIPITPKAVTILEMLQMVHDNHLPEQWEEELQIVEKRVNLYEKEEK